MSFGGGAFKAAWNIATDAAKTAVSAIATGAKKVGAVAEWVGDETVRGVNDATQATKDAAAWAARETALAAEWAKDKTVQATVTSATLAQTAFGAAQQTFSNLVAGASVVLCTAENAVVDVLAAGVGAAAGIASTIGPTALRQLGDQLTDLPNDGKLIGANCLPQGSSNPRGILPQCTQGTPQISGEVLYVNGIRTDQKTLCGTMQALAKATCAEVAGVYNAYGGSLLNIVEQLSESLANIAKNSDAPAVRTLRDQMLAALDQDPPANLTIYAHSQGGLIMQDALAILKADLTEKYGRAGALARMSRLTIKSFGTAVIGWPVGPNYEQFTNLSDPIPWAIRAAQASYPAETLTDSAVAPASQSHYFNSPHRNPIDSHSMDSVYIPEMVKIDGQPNCCG
jgi:hypothetical protein